MSDQRTAAAWPSRGSVFIAPVTSHSGIHDAHKNPYVGWRWYCDTAPGPVHKTKRAAQHDAEQTFSNIVGWTERRPVGPVVAEIASKQ